MFKSGAIYTTGSIIYASAGDAAEQTNPKPLLPKYRGHAFCANQEDILRGGKAYRLIGADGSAVGFLNENCVSVQPPQEAGQLSAHFKKSEFSCECGGKWCNGFNGIPDSELMQTAVFLEGLRAHANAEHPGAERKIIVRSGVRCSKSNAEAGGASGSQHLFGKAADISVSGLTQSQAASMCLEYFKARGHGGVGYGGGRYTHVDRRPKFETWKY